MAGHIADAGSLDWCTPDWILDLVRKALKVARIDLDPCWNPNAHTDAATCYTLPANDGLVDSWNFPTIFVNPPYGVAYVHKETRAYMSQKDFRAMMKALPTKAERLAEGKKWNRSTIASWVERCARAHREHGSEAIALIPCYPDTKVWQKTIRNTATAVCELEGRVSFRLVPPGCQHLVGDAHECGKQATHVTDSKTKLCPEHVEALGETARRMFKVKKLPVNTPAPMGCALIYWGKDARHFAEVFKDCGTFKFPMVDVLGLLERERLMRAHLQDLVDTASESTGIAGFHQNGDLMTWEEYDLDAIRALLTGDGNIAINYVRALEEFYDSSKGLHIGVSTEKVEAARAAVRAV